MGQRGKTLKHWDGDLEQENIRKKKHISNTGQRERNLEIGTWSQTERTGVENCEGLKGRQGGIKKIGIGRQTDRWRKTKIVMGCRTETEDEKKRDREHDRSTQREKEHGEVG